MWKHRYICFIGFKKYWIILLVIKLRLWSRIFYVQQYIDTPFIFSDHLFLQESHIFLSKQRLTKNGAISVSSFQKISMSSVPLQSGTTSSVPSSSDLEHVVISQRYQSRWKISLVCRKKGILSLGKGKNRLTLFLGPCCRMAFFSF